MLMSTLLFVAASAAGSLVEATTPELSLKDRMLTLFCSYSFTGYCGGPRAAPTELAETPELTAPTDPALQAVAAPAASSLKDRMLTLFCSYSFTGYCGGPRAAPTELTDRRRKLTEIETPELTAPTTPALQAVAAPAASSLKDRMLTLFCSYSFTGYCGGPRAAPTELTAATPPALEAGATRAASSLKDRMLTLFCSYSFTGYCGGPRAAPTELVETPEPSATQAASSLKDRMLTLFCSYSFTGYCGGPRAAPTELKPVAPVPEKLASPALFCGYSFSGYCMGPRAAPTELSCPGVTKDWAEHTAHTIHSATLADLRTYYNPATPVATNGVPTLTRDLQTVLANTPEVDFGSTFTDPLANKLAYHVAKQFSEDNAGLPATWRPQDILVHVMHMNELSLEVGKKYQTTKPSEETCSCLEAREGEIRAELAHIADYFRKVPEIQRKRGEFKAEDFKATNWNVNAATFQQTKENSDGMDVETLSDDAATYLKCKLGKF